MGGIYRMMAGFSHWARRMNRSVIAMAALGALVQMPLAQTPLVAQVTQVDPNVAIDADLAPAGGTTEATPPPASPPAYPPAYPPAAAATTPEAPRTATGEPVVPGSAPAAPDPNTAYQENDLIGAAEGVFGKGAEGLAGMIEKILKDQGRPNAYIAGREASGAIVVGLRYGSGTLNHKVEGQRQVYWTGPSVGFDLGGNASKTFILVYNLYDSQELYRRYPAVEGTAYLVGGFTATYLRRDNIVLIPIRLGVGYRLGVNAGYMKFSEKQRLIPF